MKTTYVRFILFISLTCFAVGWNQPMPKLFLVGDSISVRYGSFLEKYLEGTVLYERKRDDGGAEKNLGVVDGTQGGDSRMVLAYLRSKMKDPDFKPDYMVLNCGLHDIKRDTVTNEIQVNKQKYRENLKEIIQLLEQKQIEIIWIRTTPVVDSIHNNTGRSSYRYSEDVDSYNKIADEVFAEYRIPVIDLFNFTRQLGDNQSPDGVHFKESACNLQAAFIAGYIKAYVCNKP